MTSGPRGRGMARGKPITRQVNNTNEYELSRPSQPEPRIQFLPSNRGRAKRLDRPSPNQTFIVGKPINDDELRELTEQMAVADLRSNKNTSIKSEYSVPGNMSYGSSFYSSV